MCRFYSLLSGENKDGEVQVYHFTPDMRIDCPPNKNGFKPDAFDSHSTIGFYFLYSSSAEDECNKWEYNPVTDRLDLDESNLCEYDGQIEKHREAVLAAIAGIDWSILIKDIDKVRAFIKSIESTDWTQRNAYLPGGAQVFDSTGEASEAWYRDDNGGCNSTLDNAFGWLTDQLGTKVLEAISDALPYISDYLEADMKLHIAKMCLTDTMLASMPYDVSKYIDRRWAVVQAGYITVMEYNPRAEYNVKKDYVLWVAPNK